MLECVLQVEWSDSQNRNVDLHIRTERVRGIRCSGASPGERRQHWRHLSAQTGTKVAFVSWFLCPTLTHSLWNFCIIWLCSLICFPSFILFPLHSPFPFLAPISTSLPHGTLTSTGSFPESASHSKTCTAFRDTATYGWSHPVSIYWLCDCPVHQAPKRAGQLPGKTNRFEIVFNEDWLMQN